MRSAKASNRSWRNVAPSRSRGHKYPTTHKYGTGNILWYSSLSAAHFSYFEPFFLFRPQTPDSIYGSRDERRNSTFRCDRPFKALVERESIPSKKVGLLTADSPCSVLPTVVEHTTGKLIDHLNLGWYRRHDMSWLPIALGQ